MLKNLFSSLARLFRRKTRKTSAERRREFLNQFRKGHVEGLEDRSLMAALTLPAAPATSYTETFDTLGSGLPTGWTVRTAAAAGALGTVTTAGTAAGTWSDTAGGFKNLASADGSTGTESTAAQGAKTDRALGLRQTGSLGDPGAAFDFELANTANRTGFSLTFSNQMLNVQPRSTTWTAQYSTNGGTVWTTLGTYTDTAAFGSTTATYSLGSALDNLPGSVHLRVVALGASSGSGNRDTFGIDDVSLTWTNAGPSTTATTTALTGVTPLTVNQGQAVTFNGTVVASSGSTTPTGTIEIRNNGTLLASSNLIGGTGANGTFSISSSAIPAGTYSNLQAFYVAGSGFDNSSSSAFGSTLTVNAVGASTTTSLNSITPLSGAFGSPVTFSGTVVAGSGSTTPAGTIEIRDGGASGTLLASTTTIGGTGANGTFSINSSAVPVGNYSSIQAFFVPSVGFLASSSSVFGSALAINAITTTTTLGSINPLAANQGDAITFAGTIVAGSGTTLPAGTIEIRNGGATGTLLASTTTIGGSGANGTFSISSNTVPAGSFNNIQAFFVPANGFSASSSSVFASTLDVTAVGPSTLAAGDLIFTGMNLTTEQFSFVLLKNIGAGTEVFFTDGGYNGTTNGFGTTEGNIKVTFTQAYPAGSRFVWGTPGVTNFDGSTTGLTTTGTAPALANAGDSIAAYQGTAAAPTVISIVSSANFVTGAPANTNTTALPPNLTVGTDALSFGTATFNGSLNNADPDIGSLVTGTPAQIRALAQDFTNWTTSAVVVPPPVAFFVGEVIGTTTDLSTISPLTANFGTAIVFTGTVVAASGSNLPAGTIQIRDGGPTGTLLASTTTIGGTGTNGTFSIGSTTVPAGTYSNVQAYFVAGTGFTSSNSSPFGSTLTVNAVGAATATTIDSISPTTAGFGDSVTFAGTITASTGTATPAGTIEIRDGGLSGTLLASTTTISGTGANGTYSVSSTSIPVGSYSNIQAFFVPNVGFIASSSTSFGTSLTINAAATNFVSYGTPGSTYSQDFNSLATASSSTLPTGWQISESGASANTSYGAGNGASTTGDTYSFGANSDPERALGGLRSGNLIPLFGAAIKNTTGGALDSFSIGYTGEQWRIGAAGRPDQLDFQYSLDATSLTTGTWTDFNLLDFSSPNTTGAVGGIDGNTNKTTFASTMIPANIPANGVVYIRWVDVDVSGSDDGLAVDDFTFTATAANVNGSFGFSTSSYSVDENAGTATITVNRNGGAAGAVAVNYATVAGGTAVAGTDYTSTNGTLNWADGDNAPKQFTIPITDNLVQNLNKTINLALTNPTGGATLATIATSVVTITENERADLLLNEVSVNPPSATDTPYEYVELKGTPNATLSNWYVVQLAANPANTAGNAVFVTDLNNATVGSNGLLVIKATSGGHTIPAGTSVVTNPALDSGAGLSNQSQSMLLIYSSTPITVGQDLDTNNDGSLDLPAGATVIDAVGWVNQGFPSDLVYGGVSLIQGTAIPDAASRISTDNTPLSASAWFNGDLVDDGVSTPNSETAYSQTGGSANLPVGAVLTPGAPNVIATTSLSIAADIAAQLEGNSGPTLFTFTITRAGDVSGTASVNWAVTGAGAGAADATDFTGGVLPSGSVNFLANETSKQISVSVNGDLTIEGNEQFTVTLSNPIGATLASAAAGATITSDDLQILAPGDIVITGIDSTGLDEFTFVPLVNLAPLTEIRFTDQGWLAGGGFRANEGVLLYTAPAGGILAGTEISISGDGTTFTVNSPASNPGTVTRETSASSFALASGDSLIAFQGAVATPTPIYAINLSRSTFDADATSSTTSALPAGLTLGTSAVAIGGTSSAVNNGQYNNVVTSGTAAQIQAAVSNSANWTVSSTRITLDYINFVLDSGVNVAPTVNAQSFTVAESAVAGTTVGTVAATDNNAGQTLSYAFLVSSSPSQVSGPFTINATTGQITVTGTLDFETTASYPLTVQVTDNGSPALSSTATVTINVTDRSEGRIFIPTTLTANAGAPIVVPVNLQVTEVDGASVGGALIHIVYDSSKLTFSSVNLAGGPLAGFALDSSGSTPGNLVFTATGSAGATIGSGTTVTLANITFNVAAAASGTVVLNLQGNSSVADSGAALFLLAPAATNGADANVDGLVTIGSGPLAIASIVPTATGFVGTFNRAVNAANINLYDQVGAGSLGAADVTLVGANTGAVRGSLVFNANNTGFTFIKTGSLTTGAGVGAAPGTLAPDTYTITLRSSAANGFVDLDGNPLRNFAGTAAGDYTSTFTVATPAANAVTVSVPDFARGYGQAVKIPASAANGIPITISNGNNIGGIDFRLNFDPTLLSITNFVINPAILGASAGFTIVSPGVVQVTMSSGGAFASTNGSLVLGEFTATVPETAPYGSKHILSISNLDVVDASINFDPVPSIADNGVHVAAFFGDANGNQNYAAADTGLIQRAILGVNSGFTAFQNADPYIIADINYSMSFAAADTGFVQRQILNIAVPNIPALPVGVTPPVGVPGPDPKLYIPNNLSGSVDADGNSSNGIQVDIPLMLEVTEPSGITVGGFDFSFTYDTSKLTFAGSAGAPTSLSFGSILAGAGFSGAYTIPSPGTILVTASSGSGTNLLSFGTVGSLFTIRATVAAGATGTTKLNLRGGASIIDGNFEDLTLIPAPTNADTDSVDGAVILSAPVNNPPVFVGSPYTFSLPENSATGVAVGNVSANDADAGTTLVYSLSGAGSNNFAINPNTGAITVAAGATLNFEGIASFALTASVSDGTATVNAPVTINLTNVNEGPTLAPQTFSVAENSVNTTVVGTVVANDVDAGDTKSFAITAGNASGAFAINQSTGAITVANSSLLNFETTPSFTLTVSVTDGGSLSASNTITINLTNVVEPTTFANQTFSLPENTANGITVGTATAVPDTGVTITGYAITAGNGTGVGAFSINSSGVIQVNDGSQLNFEVTPTFTLTVTATDSTSAVTTSTVTVNLTNVNEQPIQTLNRTITINPGQVIQLGSALLSFADPENATLTYTITSAPTRGTLTKNGAAITSFTSTDLNASSSLGNAIRYTGTTGTAGQTDSFTVTVSDGANTITGVVVNINIVAPVGPASFTGVYTQNFDNLLPTPVPADRLTLPTAMVLPAGWSVIEYGGTFGTVGGNAEQSIQIDSGTSTTGDTFLYGNPGSNERSLGAFSSGSLQAYLGLAIVNNSGAPLSNFTLSFVGEQWKDGVHASAVNKLTFDYSTTATSLGATTGFTSVTALDFTAPVAAAVTGADVVLDGNLAANRTAVSATVTGVSWAPGATLFLRWKDLNDAGNDDMLAIDNVTLSTNTSPTIANQAFSLAENSANGAAAGTVVASDADVGQTLSYAITGGNASGAFAINASTGAITVADSSQLNFETTPSFPLTVTVTDDGASPVSSSATVTINLTNVDEAPTFGAASYSLSVAENSTTGAAVGAVSATDPDAGASLTYSLSGTGSSNFVINPSTGAITVASGAVLNFEGTNTFSLTASVTDGTHPVSVPVTISLTNVNEAPTIGAQSFSVSEQAAIGATVGTVLASDVDAADTKTFAITGGNTGNAFAISASGVITVAAELDFNTTPVYTLTVSVTDGGNLSASNTVTINVTNVNSAPTIAPQTFSVPENSANGTTIGSVLASDVDAGDLLAFAITGGNASGAFAISPAGVLSVANGSLLNFEGTPSYSLTVSVTDNGSPVGSSSATITINLTNVNEAPTLAPQAFSVAENSANGATVGTVVANDVDAGDTKSFAITAGNSSGAFAINASTGVITVANGSLLNFEGTSSYPLTVSVTDSGSLSASNTVTVNLTNVNEAPTIAPQTFSVAENSANGAAVGTVVANDVDASDSKSFAITAGNSSGAFAINASTGAITVANGSLLNFEGTPSYSLTVSVTDGGSLSVSATITINLTNVNEAPAITSGNAFSVAENTTAVTTVTGLDPDAIATLAYSIVGGLDAGKFTIDHDLGLLSFLSAPNFENPGDIGGNNVYDLIVRVSDGSLSGDKAIAVTVTNVNEAPTIANQSFSVLDTVATGFTVGTVVANDVDAGDTKTFAITGGNTGNAFAISPSGVITVANTLNSAVTPSYSLTVSVTDAGNLSSSATVTITVNHLNSNPTNISLSNATIAENAGVNGVVGLLSTTDPDLPSDTHTYTLMTTGTGSTDFASFNISGNQLRANGNLDFETKPSYSIRVKSTDQGGASVEKVFTIFVTDVPETGNQAPTNILLSGSTVAPGALNGIPVGFLTTSDSNAGDSFNYSLGGANASKFMIAGTVLRLASDVTDPVGTVYNITVTSTDQGGLSTTKAFAITVSGAPNAAPTFINLSSFTIAENNLVGALVGSLSTTDPNPGNTFTYTLVSGTGSTDNGSFSIASGSNELRANASFDFEAKTSYQIRVRSTDQGGLSTERALTIYIANVVETGNQAPTNIALSGLTVPPAAAGGTNVGTLTTTDPNSGNTFTYTLGGTDAAKFVVSNGVLQVAPAAVIGPVGTTYSVSITSTDQGNLSFTKTFTIAVANPLNVAPNGLTLSNATIAENAGSNALIGTFTSSDLNANDTHTYSLVSGLGGDDNALFTIVNNQLFAVNSFDYEMKTSYKIRVRTTDQGGLFYDKAITVFIANVVGA
ncbi:cadherin domain-containing protein [Anatilimnocola floriformis]|uniref:cadherin domain-containing protein n=1 Tax=Anatilimnocola floriformis TaxID=2948575 RepID=UPI0020C348D6|nr:cadherin domain-containing protein [Anatilimnocola floriformis]